VIMSAWNSGITARPAHNASADVLTWTFAYQNESRAVVAVITSKISTGTAASRIRVRGVERQGREVGLQLDELLRENVIDIDALYGCGQHRQRHWVRHCEITIRVNCSGVGHFICLQPECRGCPSKNPSAVCPDPPWHWSLSGSAGRSRRSALHSPGQPAR